MGISREDAEEVACAANIHLPVLCLDAKEVLGAAKKRLFLVSWPLIPTGQESLVVKTDHGWPQLVRWSSAKPDKPPW